MRIEIGADQFFIDSFGVAAIGDDLAHRVYQFGPATVVEADVEADTGVVARQVDRILHGLLNVRREVLQAAKMAQANSFSMQFLDIGTDGLPEETHQPLHFGAWTPPVLG